TSQNETMARINIVHGGREPIDTPPRPLTDASGICTIPASMNTEWLTVVHPVFGVHYILASENSKLDITLEDSGSFVEIETINEGQYFGKVRTIEDLYIDTCSLFISVDQSKSKECKYFIPAMPDGELLIGLYPSVGNRKSKYDCIQGKLERLSDCDFAISSADNGKTFLFREIAIQPNE
ncbi:MAG: hypothetical protein L3J82_10810, partial [Planctomycetes bacterium]|nr:hypothetical protein [Planctomycetota bacterium]